MKAHNSFSMRIFCVLWKRDSKIRTIYHVAFRFVVSFSVLAPITNKIIFGTIWQCKTRIFQSLSASLLESVETFRDNLLSCFIPCRRVHSKNSCGVQPPSPNIAAASISPAWKWTEFVARFRVNNVSFCNICQRILVSCESGRTSLYFVCLAARQTLAPFASCMAFYSTQMEAIVSHRCALWARAATAYYRCHISHALISIWDALLWTKKNNIFIVPTPKNQQKRKLFDSYFLSPMVWSGLVWSGRHIFILFD